MKIAIPVTENHFDGNVCPSFGRTPYYLFYDVEGKREEFLANQAADSPGGAGIQAAQFLVNQKVSAVLAPRLGENAAQVLKGAGILVYRTENDSIQDSLLAFEEGRLKILDEIHPGFHNHGEK
jgi:predicted Fe-Mo cluster-binding NifX family protein